MILLFLRFLLVLQEILNILLFDKITTNYLIIYIISHLSNQHKHLLLVSH